MRVFVCGVYVDDNNIRGGYSLRLLEMGKPSVPLLAVSAV
jgi:hypothetical protein